VQYSRENFIQGKEEEKRIEECETRGKMKNVNAKRKHINNKCEIENNIIETC
jgi:hypothetical protein